jgi:N-acetylmuramoyl-L-alanine amidase
MRILLWAALLTAVITGCTSTRYVGVPEYHHDTVYKARGFKTIGYHFVIYRDGSIHKGRPVSEEGAHCVGHNANRIGVCYIGGLAADGKTPKDTRTDAQKLSLHNLLSQLKKSYPNAAIRGHRDFAAKACPSLDATKEYCNL